MKRIIEFFAFTYFNWIVVVPLLIPWMIFIVGIEEDEFWIWFYTSFAVSLYVGWIVVKADSIFAPWFYRRIGLSPKKSRNDLIVDALEEELRQLRLARKTYYKYSSAAQDKESWKRLVAITAAKVQMIKRILDR